MSRLGRRRRRSAERVFFRSAQGEIRGILIVRIIFVRKHQSSARSLHVIFCSQSLTNSKTALGAKYRQCSISLYACGNAGQTERADGAELFSRQFEGMQQTGLPAKDCGENKWRNNGRIGFDDKLRRVDPELPPSDFLVRHCARVAAIARGRVADLAEISPKRNAIASADLGAASAPRRSESRPRYHQRSGRIRSSRCHRLVSLWRYTIAQATSCIQSRFGPCGRF